MSTGLIIFLIVSAVLLLDLGGIRSSLLSSSDPINDALYGINGAVNSLGNTVNGTVNSLGNTVGGVAGNLGNTVGGVVGTVGGVAGNLGNTVGGVVGTVGGIAGNLGNTVGGIAGNLGNTVGGVVDTIGGVVGTGTGIVIPIDTHPAAAPVPGDQPGINIGSGSGSPPVNNTASVVVPLVLYPQKSFGGNPKFVLPGQTVQIAYIGSCDGSGGSGCSGNPQGPTKWLYQSMKVNPGVKLHFFRSAGINQGNLGGHSYYLDTQELFALNADDLQQYLQEHTDIGADNNASPNGGTLVMSRDYWPSPIFVKIASS